MVSVLSNLYCFSYFLLFSMECPDWRMQRNMKFAIFYILFESEREFLFSVTNVGILDLQCIIEHRELFSTKKNNNIIFSLVMYLLIPLLLLLTYDQPKISPIKSYHSIFFAQFYLVQVWCAMIWSSNLFSLDMHVRALRSWKWFTMKVHTLAKKWCCS